MTDVGSLGNSDKVQMCLGVWIWESLMRKVDLKLCLEIKRMEYIWE